LWIINPSFDKNAIVWLELEIFCHIIYNDHFVDVSTNPA
jgi:hypothetical protein